MGFNTLVGRAFWSGSFLLVVPSLLLASYLTGGPISVAFGAAFYATAVSLICTMLIAFLIKNRDAGYLSFFRIHALTFLGAISYAFYMTHAYVMELYDHYRGPLPLGDTASYAIRFFTILALTIGISIISRHVLELPAASLRKYVLRRD